MARRVVRGKQPAGELHLSFDRKVSPTATYQKSRDRWIPTVPNSFGLPSGDSCPGMTSFCGSCYASRSEQSAGVRAAVEHNLRLLQATDLDGMTDLLDRMLDRYEEHADAAAIPTHQRMFRIHWDGDFYSVEYAEAWREVILRHPHVAFWTYTRSFRAPVDVVPSLIGLPNLALYLSIDADNAADASAALALPDVLAAGCAVDYQTARALLPDRPSRAAVPCPENTGRIGLSDENGTGACVTCRICPDARRDILFSTSHREDASVPLPRPRRAEPAGPLHGPPAPTECPNPTCDGHVHQRLGPGRPRTYCTDACRADAYHQRQVVA